MNCDRGMWRCPVCNSTAQLEGLEVDHYIWGILSQLGRYVFIYTHVINMCSTHAVPCYIIMIIDIVYIIVVLM